MGFVWTEHNITPHERIRKGVCASSTTGFLEYSILINEILLRIKNQFTNWHKLEDICEIFDGSMNIFITF